MDSESDFDSKKKELNFWANIQTYIKKICLITQRDILGIGIFIFDQIVVIFNFD